MDEARLIEIEKNDVRMQAQLDALLLKEGIRRDANIEYSVGIADGDYRLMATGSCFRNTLRCLAVDSAHRGEGLMNTVVSALQEHVLSQGYAHQFLYTKCDKEAIFADLGFHTVVKIPDRLVFMENKRTGFASYLDALQRETEEELKALPSKSAAQMTGRANAAVVMNANPFTLGHRALLEEAVKSAGLVHVFVVSEDCSLVPFSVRERLVKEGSVGLCGLIFHRTGDYLISAATFPSYFMKDEDTAIEAHALLDTAVFCQIADRLCITERFVGEEPFSRVTALYNHTMERELKKGGVTLRVISRKTENDAAISASEVRVMLKENRMDEVRRLVPESTWRFFASKEALPVLSRIRAEEEVRHY